MHFKHNLFLDYYSGLPPPHTACLPAWLWCDIYAPNPTRIDTILSISFHNYFGTICTSHICNAYSDWLRICLLISFCYLKLFVVYFLLQTYYLPSGVCRSRHLCTAPIHMDEPFPLGWVRYEIPNAQPSIFRYIMLPRRSLTHCVISNQLNINFK